MNFSFWKYALVLSWVLAAVVIQIHCVRTSFASPPLTAGELIERTDLKHHLGELEQGEIVLTKRSETESENELNVIMSMLVSAPLKKTVDTLQGQAGAEDFQGTIAAGRIEGSTKDELEKAFAGIAFTPEEKQEVEKMMKIEAGDDFNFSADEIRIIQHKAGEIEGKAVDGTEAAAAMSDAVRRILQGRYLSYREKGMEGLAPYQIGSSKQVHPSEELVGATEALRLVKERFPDYHRCLLSFPETPDFGFLHQFFWEKQVESNRPLFVLKHWVLDIQPDYALITERRYYLSHSLNSLQVVIGCLPHGNRTLVVLLNQAFTEKVNMTIGRTIAKKIGYRQVEKNIRPMFEALQTQLDR